MAGREERAVAVRDGPGGRRKQLDATNDGVGPDDEAVPHIAGETDRVDFALEKVAREERANLGGEEQRAFATSPPDGAEIQRLDAEAVTREQQRAQRGVPQRECEHPAKTAHAIHAPARVGLEDDLRI